MVGPAQNLGRVLIELFCNPHTRNIYGRRRTIAIFLQQWWFPDNFRMPWWIDLELSQVVSNFLQKCIDFGIYPFWDLPLWSLAFSWYLWEFWAAASSCFVESANLLLAVSRKPSTAEEWTRWPFIRRLVDIIFGFFPVSTNLFFGCISETVRRIAKRNSTNLHVSRKPSGNVFFNLRAGELYLVLSFPGFFLQKKNLEISWMVECLQYLYV